MKHSGIALSDLNPAMQKQAADQLYAKEHPNLVEVRLPIESLRHSVRLRQSRKPILNKLEQRFYDYMVGPMKIPATCILSQAIRLELARGHWYKPDFFLPGNLRPEPYYGFVAYEVKGPKAFRGGFENLKVAARIHRWLKFELVWLEDGKWKQQPILS